MNKDVIYIDPEDDISDIITKIENSKEKIIALVPPKKAGILRSVVNVKLLMKSGLAAKKTVVLVTTDPSIIKIAGAVKMPVTKNLQTAPTIPGGSDAVEKETVSKEKLEKNLGDEETEEDAEEESEPEETETEDETEKDAEEEPKKKDKESAEESSEKTELEGKKGKKKKGEKKESSNKFIAWFSDHKKLAIFGGVFGVLLIVVLVWALVIAPAATVTVGIRTNSNNFSESVSFTTKLEEEKIEEGKFYLKEEKYEVPSTVEFEATGKKNVGEKAKGDVIIYDYFPSKGGSSQVNAGATFTISGFTYTADSAVTLSWNGKNIKDCENFGQISIMSGCLVSARVNVTATNPGEKYNISASETGWSTSAAVGGVYSDKAMSGGTDEYVTIVSQADVDKAKEELATVNEAENKTKLFEDTKDENEDAFIIESSFKQTTSEAKSTPAVGEEVKEGTKPKISVTTTASVFTIDEVKVKEYITEKAKISESQKIYEMKDPFIESFMKTENGYTGKLKTSYITGSKITENEVIEIIKGKGLGVAQHDIKDVEGISSIRIDTSYPWVSSIPNDPNKITVILEVQEQE